MDLGLFERVWNEVSPLLLTASLWGWGEPLLHPRLRDILRIASASPVATLLSTNGQLLDRPETQQALLDFPPTYLIVCLDGLTDETNQVYRRGARLEGALEGVRRIAAAKRERNQASPILHMRYIVMRHNEHELPLIDEFARDACFDLLTIRTLSITDSSGDDYRHYVPAACDWRAYEFANGERVRRADYICQQPFWFPTLYSDGTLVPCDQDSAARLPYGQITSDRTFADLWFGRDSTRVRRIIRDAPETLQACRNCPFADRPAEACSVRAVGLRGPVVARVGSPSPIPDERPASGAV
jgi:radical SAM protein with 4Fe4S-binding SPASM domain